jgi:hypothetical protein
MKTFFYNGKNWKVMSAVIMANKCIKNPEFIERVRSIKKFDMATENDGSGVTGNELADLISGITFPDLRANVMLYRPKWPWSKALAKYNPAKGPKNIYLNACRLKKRSTASIAGSLGHEFIHEIDHFAARFYLGHADNRPEKKQRTAPYYFGKLMKDFCLEKY